jgi:hypothetical protein
MALMLLGFLFLKIVETEAKNEAHHLGVCTSGFYLRKLMP